jgi:hypothetical protein
VWTVLQCGLSCGVDCSVVWTVLWCGLGGWHPSAIAIFTRLGRQVASNVGQEVMRHLRQRLAVLLVRDNVAMLCARTPTYPMPEDDGDTE